MESLSEKKRALFEMYLKIKKITLELVEARGYSVPKSQKKIDEYTLEDFINEFTVKGEIDYEALSFDFFDERGFLLYIEFVPPSGGNTQGTDFADEFVAKMHQKTAKAPESGSEKRFIPKKTGIAIIPEELSPTAKNKLADVYPFYIEVFNVKYLTYNPTKLGTSPKYTILSEREQRDLLAKFKIKIKQLPIVLEDGPVPRFYGLKVGQVVRREMNNFLSDTLTGGFDEYFAVEHS